MFQRGETGWQILSPCGGVLVYNWEKSDYRFVVLEESDFDMEIEPYDDCFTIICIVYGELQYVSSNDTWVSALELDPSDTKAQWEIIPLPAGAIIDVPKRVEMANRTFESGDPYDPNYYATKIELSDAMGFACAHEVIAEELTFTRELKAGWQGFCAPIALARADWEPFGKLYRLGEAIEETDADGKVTISLRLVETEEFEPNKPYLLNVENQGTLSVSREECLVKPSGTIQSDATETTNARLELSCVYDFTEVPYTTNDAAIKAYALSGGVFKRPTSAGVKLKPYRVMLTVTSTGEHPARIAVKTDSDEEVTIIEAIEPEHVQPQWYDLNGRPATQASRGLLISPASKTIKQ